MIALSIVTSRQVTYWSDSITLFRHALDVTTDNWLIHNNLAGVINRLAVVDLQEGRADLAAQRWKEASQNLEEALRIYPTAAWVHNHYGSALGLMGKLYESQTEFEKAIALNPNRLMHYLELGRTYAQMGRNADARKFITTGLAMAETEKDRSKKVKYKDVEYKVSKKTKEHFDLLNPQK